MSLYWSVRIPMFLYFVLLALVAFNLTLLLELRPWLTAAPVALALVAVVVVWLALGSRKAVCACLLTVGTIGLGAVALVLTVPAWQVISSGASGSWAGRMLPMCIAALALHACNLWVSTVMAGEQQDPLERLARLLYGPGLLPSLLSALILCAALILGLELLAEDARFDALTRRVLERGIIPPLTVLMFFWGVLLLFGKGWNGWYLRRILARWHAVARATSVFTASVMAPTPFSASLNALRGNPNTLEKGLQLLWRRHEESWLIPRYLGWAVPILGFIGTVLGISLAAEGIRRIIASEAGLTSLSSDLDGAIAPLGIAFDTTLIALSLSVALILLLTLIQRGEERLLALLERYMRDTVQST